MERAGDRGRDRYQGSRDKGGEGRGKRRGIRRGKEKGGAGGRGGAMVLSPDLDFEDGWRGGGGS